MQGNETKWWEPENWPRGCDGCRDLHLLLVFGWMMPHVDWERRQADVRRVRYWDQMWLARRLPTIEVDGQERVLHWNAPREVWESVEWPHTRDGDLSDKALDDKFEGRGPGRPRLHRHIGREVVRRGVKRIADAIAHLEEVPRGELKGHFDRVWGETWPPHLEEVHELLLEKWRRDDRDLTLGERRWERKGTARRIAALLPLGASRKVSRQNGAVTVEWRDHDLTESQIENLYFRPTS